MEPHKPHTSYLICGTPRSGSFLLCEALKNTGIAGRPEEYFWGGDGPFNGATWNLPHYPAYFERALTEGTTPNGVFGAKVMWGYVEDFAAKLRDLPQYAAYRDLSLHDLMAAVFPNLHYIWITRRDKEQQAVSFWRAMQTRVWAVTTDYPSGIHDEGPLDVAEVSRLEQEVVTHEAAWQRYFAEGGITPFQVVYEDLVPAYEETALRILRYLNIPIPENLQFTERQMKKQADGRSEEYVRQYRAFKQARL